MSDVMRSGDEPYARAWRKYRNWSRAFWLVFFSFLPGVALIDRFVRQARGDAANNLTYSVHFSG